MEASKLYSRLDKDFIKPGMTDDWVSYMDSIRRFLSDNFKVRQMGLVCDNSHEIKRVYTAVFPTDAVLKEVAKSKDALLFLHHPSIWDITKAPEVFQQMNPTLLERLRQQRDSIYALHVPLDNFSSYSTSTTLAKSLKVFQLKPFAPYGGGLAGVYGKTRFKTREELRKMFRKAAGHRISLYPYGQGDISNGEVALVAGGGNDIKILREVADLGINTFVTGITALNSYSQAAHDFARKHRINILGGTHYSTEKFACMKMCEYFRKRGLLCRFIPGKPGLEDL